MRKTNQYVHVLIGKLSTGFSELVAVQWIVDDVWSVIRRLVYSDPFFIENVGQSEVPRELGGFGFLIRHAWKFDTATSSGTEVIKVWQAKVLRLIKIPLSMRLIVCLGNLNHLSVDCLLEMAQPAVEEN